MEIVLFCIGVLIFIGFVIAADDSGRKKRNKESDDIMDNFKADEKFHTEKCFIGLLFDYANNKARFVHYDTNKRRDFDCSGHGKVQILSDCIAFTNYSSCSTLFGAATGIINSKLMEVKEVKNFVADKFLFNDKMATYSDRSMLKDVCVAVDSKAKKVLFVEDANKPSNNRLCEYKDIISVEILEDGNSVFSKSTTRTIGGALVGNVLMGGAGAVVGGLSGNSKKIEKVKSIIVKILLRSVDMPSMELCVYEGSQIKTDSQKYKTCKKLAEDIKDVISVIIDSVDRDDKPTPVKVEEQKTSITEDLMKLAQLKKEGLLTDDEFSNMKAKLLNQ